MRADEGEGPGGQQHSSYVATRDAVVIVALLTNSTSLPTAAADWDASAPCTEPNASKCRVRLCRADDPARCHCHYHITLCTSPTGPRQQAWGVATHVVGALDALRHKELHGLQAPRRLQVQLHELHELTGLQQALVRPEQAVASMVSTTPSRRR